MAKHIFSKSDSFTTEYCCSIVKIGKIQPIQGKDKIGFTIVNGETIVVRKDMVTEGDVLFYVSNETQLNDKFLSLNNLFESSSYELNSNATDIKPYVLKNKQIRVSIDAIEKSNKKIKSCCNFLIEYETQMMVTEDEEKVEELKKLYNISRQTIIKHTNNSLKNTSSDNDFIIASQSYIIEKEEELNKLKKEYEYNSDIIRSNTGFFNKNCRVRAIRLGGVLSMGYLFSLNELAKYNPKVKSLNVNELIGEDFDSIDGEVFVKAYIPFIPQRGSKGEGNSRNKNKNKKLKKFDRLVNGEFLFHYSTDPLPKCINHIKPNDIVTLTTKYHGTSVVVGKLHVKTPIKLPLHKLLWNKIVDTIGFLKPFHIKDYMVEYGNITSSRNVIKNKYINKNVNDGFYGSDIWSEYGNLIYPYIDEGMTVYGEICGYITNSDKMIQKGYDYGCKVGENKIIPYRITTTNPNGTKREWDVIEVKQWTEDVIKNNPEISDKIQIIDILYHGTLMSLYPDIPLNNDWCENILECLRNDKEKLHMEKNCPYCKHKVPFEGIVLRIDNDAIAEAFKLKCKKFLDKERIDIDNGEVDMEMLNNF